MENDKVWPPTPRITELKEAVEVKVCPHCKRKLLTQTSVLCNWCGVKIDDPEYQEKAAQNRQARDEAERLALDTIEQEEAQFGGTWGRLRRKAKMMKKKPNILSPGND